eukprot:sb/3470224/
MGNCKNHTCHWKDDIFLYPTQPRSSLYLIRNGRYERKHLARANRILVPLGPDRNTQYPIFMFRSFNFSSADMLRDSIKSPKRHLAGLYHPRTLYSAASSSRCCRSGGSTTVSAGDTAMNLCEQSILQKKFREERKLKRKQMEHIKGPVVPLTREPIQQAFTPAAKLNAYYANALTTVNCSSPAYLREIRIGSGQCCDTDSTRQAREILM